MATSKGFHPTELETMALDLAWKHYEKWSSLNRQFPQFLEPDRQDFTNLGRAVRQLRAAIEPFICDPTSSKMGRLAFRLQDAESCQQQQSFYRDMVESLYEPLRLLDDSTREEVGGAGRAVDQSESRWILTAAGKWSEVCTTVPSASGGSRFFQALTAYQYKQPTPAITERNVRTILAERKRAAAADKPTSTPAFPDVPFTEDVVAYAIDATLSAISPALEPEVKRVIASRANQQTKRIFGGDRLYIPKGSSGRSERDDAIRRDRGAGVKISALSQRYGLGKSRLWQIINS
jgi:hypothetical protein